MTDDEDSTVMDSLARQTRIEARQFGRLFKTPDGQAVLTVLKRDFGWDAATPMPSQDGEISAARLRAWTGSRAVIATILHSIAKGENLEKTND